MWKYFAIAAITLIVGAVASPLILRYVAGSYDSQVELMEAWSSEGKDWTEFSRFIEAGGRAYWSSVAVINCLEKGADEEDIRRSIGPPDAVLIGDTEISSSFKLGVQAASSVPSDRRRPLDYIPYLEKGTAGLYVYKMGRRAYNTSYIEQYVMYLEFSTQGKLTFAFIIPVSASNPIGDFARDTRTNRRVRSGDRTAE
jgi:hypothetical protein